MTIDLRRSFAAACLVLAYCLTAVARADEPTTAETPQAEAGAQTGDDVKAARKRLAEYIDKSAVPSDFIDLASMLVSSNGLGIDVALPDAALQAQLNLAEREGVTVTSVPDESLGAKAGLQVHDVIIQLDQHGVDEPANFSKLLESASGSKVKLKLWRAGKLIELVAAPKQPEATSVKLAAEFDLQLATLALTQEQRYRLGLTLSEADETLRTHLRLAAGEGLVVTEVLDGSAAAQAGVLAHDVLTLLDGKRLTTVEAANSQIQEIQDKSVELRLLRGGKEVILQIAPRKTPETAFRHEAVTVWDTQNCKTCHKDPFQADPHRLLGWKLGADKSVWTDGNHTRLYHYERAFQAQLAAGQQAVQPASAQHQIESLKAQLLEMQKTLTVLEGAIRQPPAAKSDETPKQD